MDDDTPVPCDLCGQCVPFNMYASHSVQCSLRVPASAASSSQQFSEDSGMPTLDQQPSVPPPWVMWYRAAANAVSNDPVENPGRTWLTFLHFTNDAAGLINSDNGQRGLSSDIIDAALGPVGSDRAGSFRMDDVCPVCLDTFHNRSPDQPLAQINQCGHVFCGSCINTWLAEHGRTCPVCKCSIGPIDDLYHDSPVATTDANRAVVIGLVMSGVVDDRLGLNDNYTNSGNDDALEDDEGGVYDVSYDMDDHRDNINDCEEYDGDGDDSDGDDGDYDGDDDESFDSDDVRFG